MEELVKVTTGAQGVPVVSARELYDFLGFASSQWSRWSKKNIVNNRFARAGEDWEGFDIVSSGNQTADYALTLDFAKRLSMLAPTEKGEEIRGYFIDCERRTQQQPVTDPILVLAQAVQQQTQLILEQGHRITQLEQRTYDRPPLPPTRPGLALPGQSIVRGEALRRALVSAVDSYTATHGATHRETWHYLYVRLHDLYRIRIWDYQQGNESLLTVAERRDLLDKLYGIAQMDLKPVSRA